MIELTYWDVYCVTLKPLSSTMTNPFVSEDVKLGFICPHQMLNDEMLVYVQHYHKTKYKMNLELTEQKIGLTQEDYDLVQEMYLFMINSLQDFDVEFFSLICNMPVDPNGSFQINLKKKMARK